MEDVAPPLELCGIVRMQLEAGDSLNVILHTALRQKNCPMRQDILEVLLAHERKQKLILPSQISLERRTLLDLLYGGLCGAPIRQSLIALESEIVESSHRDIERFVAVLPVRLLLPMIFLIFPALLVILLGPVLSQIMEGLK